ncbi:caspase family protein [Ramlibacter albus]|uniref:Caspase family protein n=1 Tax=Ramlibacter albus TaxID=2079448 RepID=A0A923M752_9BURK|nr:caspase family protein [Ramlibacter albus]MBC5764590.1 caspase family protein [Ramlibacter albus]
MKSYAVARALLAFTGLAFTSSEAQSPLDVRVALVIGNTAYQHANPLPNAGKDAEGVATALRTLGFKVEHVRDATREDMDAALARTRQALDKRNGLAMLYYAGHGLQVSWRNYMVPVDARVTNAADLPKTTFDVAGVLDTFARTGSRMNIIVLDACRENPFPAAGGSRGLAQMGAPIGTFLAYATQPGALAEDGDDKMPFGPYADSLILELGRPGSRVEDVFKRVRFHVRRKTEGRQVPWDATTLEEDFVFNDGKNTVKLDPTLVARMITDARQREQQLREEAERARQRERELAEAAERAKREAEIAAERARRESEVAAQRKREEEAAQAREREAQLARARADEEARKKRLEMEAAMAIAAARQQQQVQEEQVALAALQNANAQRRREEFFRIEKAKWDQLKDSRDPALLYDYLLAHPSGAISELAQARLEVIQPAKVTPQADQTGLVQPLAAKRFRMGDRYEFVVRDLFTRLQVERPVFTVVRATDEEAEFDQGYRVTQAGAIIRTIGGATLDPYQQWIPAGEYSVGRKWYTRSIMRMPDGTTQWVELNGKVVARETIEVPAGRFDTFKMEMEQLAQDGTRLKITYWGQPDWGVAIRQIREVRDTRGALSGQIYEMAARSRR